MPMDAKDLLADGYRRNIDALKAEIERLKDAYAISQNDLIAANLQKDADAKVIEHLRSGIEGLEEKYHQSTANVADLIGKLEQSNLQNESLKRIESEFRIYKQRSEEGGKILFDRVAAAELQSSELQKSWDLLHTAYELEKERKDSANRLVRDLKNVIDLAVSDLIVAQKLGDGSNRVASAVRMLKECQEMDKRKCPSTYTHTTYGKLLCEKDEAHLNRRGDVEHSRDGVKWMSV